MAHSRILYFCSGFLFHTPHVQNYGRWQDSHLLPTSFAHLAIELVYHISFSSAEFYMTTPAEVTDLADIKQDPCKATSASAALVG